MQPLEILPPTPDHPLSPGSEWSNPLKDQLPSEQFDQLIGRALSRSSNTAPDDRDPSDDPSPRRTRAEQNRKSKATVAPQPEAGVGADYSATQSSLRKAAAVSPDDSNPKSQDISRVEGVSGTSPTAGTRADSSATGATDSRSLTEQLRNLLPASDVNAQAPQKALPGDPASIRNASGLPSESDGSAPVADEQNPQNGVLDGLLPGAGETASLGNGIVDSAGKAAGHGSAAAVQLLPPVGSGDGGISGAKQQLPMQKAEKTNESSASTEQNLPVSLAQDAGEKLPTRTTGAIASPSRSEKSELSTIAGTTTSSVTASPESASRPSEAVHWPSAAPARSLERTHDLMSLHAFRLRDSGADSLQVVIKPGTGLQLSLNLQLRGGNMEMRATLHRGDFDFLSRHWSQLQQQLEARGIRLAPLTRGDEMAGGNSHPFQNPDHSPAGNDATPAGELAEIALTSSLKPIVAPKPGTLRGWESWA